VQNILDEVQKNYTRNPQHLLFYDDKSTDIIKPYEINCYLKRIAKKYKITDTIHNHMLRHTFATRCIEANSDYKTVSVILGHSYISTTLNLYVHPNKEQKKKCIDKMLKSF
jgi:integrase